MRATSREERGCELTVSTSDVSVTHEDLMRDPALHATQGLFDPLLEKDSCGVGFIADIKGRKSHALIEDALAILCNLEHRGAVGADPRAGDGACILVQTPHKFFKRVASECGFTLPDPEQYAVGYVFMPHEAEAEKVIKDIWAEVVAKEGQ